jgi:cytochrome P450
MTGAGPRICIGAVFALSEAQIMLAKVLERYTLAIESRRLCEKLDLIWS